MPQFPHASALVSQTVVCLPLVFAVHFTVAPFWYTKHTNKKTNGHDHLPFSTVTHTERNSVFDLFKSTQTEDEETKKSCDLRFQHHRTLTYHVQKM